MVIRKAAKDAKFDVDGTIYDQALPARHRLAPAPSGGPDPPAARRRRSAWFSTATRRRFRLGSSSRSSTRDSTTRWRCSARTALSSRPATPISKKTTSPTASSTPRGTYRPAPGAPPTRRPGPDARERARRETKTIPLEVFAIEDKEPTYGVRLLCRGVPAAGPRAVQHLMHEAWRVWQITLEDDGRPLSQPKLPFSVYGTVLPALPQPTPPARRARRAGSVLRGLRAARVMQLAMARSEDNANDASSQFFFLLFDPELTTAGRNLMDGRFATFGYVTSGNRLLSNVEQGDTIVSAKIISGKDKLINAK